MKPGVIIDTITGGVGSGDVAMRLLESNFDIGALRTNDVLRKDEWKQYDKVLVEVATKRLPLVTFLVGQGLTFSIGDGLGTTILEWEDVSDMEPAQVSMAGVTRGEQDTLEYGLKSMPLPIIHKDFTINIRKLHASRTTGQPVDTAQAAVAGRLVAEATESMVIAGHATKVGTSVIYGIGNVPNSSAVTMSGTATWGVDSTAAEIITDCLAAIAALETDHMYGPYALLVDYATWNFLQTDYEVTTNTGRTILARILQIEGISTVIPSRDVPAATAYMFQLTSDVIDEVIAMQPTVVQWESQGGMQVHFKIMSIMIPRVRWTQTLQSGIAVLS